MENLSELTLYLSLALRLNSKASATLKPLIESYPLSQFSLNDDSIHLINSLSSNSKNFLLKEGISSLPAIPAIIAAVLNPHGAYSSYKEAITLNPLPNEDLRALIEIALAGRDHNYLQLNKAIPFLLSIYEGKDRAYLSAKARLIMEGEKR